MSHQSLSVFSHLHVRLTITGLHILLIVECLGIVRREQLLTIQLLFEKSQEEGGAQNGEKRRSSDHSLRPSVDPPPQILEKLRDACSIRALMFCNDTLH